MGKISKVVVCGMKGVGKTAILEQVIYGNISEKSELYPTIEDIYVANIESDKGTKEKVRFYDTAGIDYSQISTSNGTTNQQLPRHYLVLVDGYVLVYDTSNKVPKEMILELQSRLENLNKLFSDYDEIQNSIEVECDDNNLEQQLIQREEFEDLHYSLASECKNIIDNYYSLTEDRSASIRSGESEHHSSTHSQMVEHCKIKLPSINLPKFSGDYKNWMEFRDFFISIIHSKENIPQINKFHYLRSSLEGGAAQELSCLVIPAISDSYPTNQLNVKSWQIPKNIRLADTQFYKPGEVDLLIGGGIYLNLLCIGQVTLGPNLPTLQKTKLGWVVGGDAIARTINPTYRCNFVGNLHEDIVKFWELEEPNVVKPVWSEEDKCCEEIFVSTVSRNQEGRFVVQIPFKISPDEHLGDSKEVAITIVVIGNKIKESETDSSPDSVVNTAIQWCTREKIKHFTVSALKRNTLYEPFVHITSKLIPPTNKSSFTPLSMGRKVMKDSS
nr:unnamed protein product [Callosobruchus analis]